MKLSNRQILASMCLMAACLLTVLVSDRLVAYPEPAPVDRYWQFNFSHDQPKLTSIISNEGQKQWYWYIQYKVENNTGDDRLFIPEVAVATDTGKVITAGPNLDAKVFAKIKKHIGNKLLEHPSVVVDTLLQGPDHARESIICWLAPEEDVDQYRVFVSGLSGEIEKISNPLTGEQVIMRKTLMMEYATPGSYPLERDQPVLPRSENWVMR